MKQPKQSNDLFETVMLDRVSFGTGQLSKDEYRLMLTNWIISIFFKEIMPCKPILAFIGEKGSGKSITLRKLGLLLYGSHFDVTPVPAKEDDFITAITNKHFVALDNADTRQKWLEDRLAAVATGATVSKRKLYTDNQIIETPIRCYLGITSRNPHFRRDDIADRLLIIPVSRFDSFIEESLLLKEVLDSRNELMTDLVGRIQDTLRALGETSTYSPDTSLRMADFGAFCMRQAKHHDKESTMCDIMARIVTEQSLFTLEGEPWLELLEEWVDENEGHSITATDLCAELSRLADRKGKPFYWRDRERAFAHQLARLKPNLERFFIVKVHEGGGRKRLFSFATKTEESHA